MSAFPAAGNREHVRSWKKGASITSRVEETVEGFQERQVEAIT